MSDPKAMTEGGFNLRHILLIARFSMRHALRGGSGIVYFLLATTFVLTVASQLLTPVENAIHAADDAGIEREVMIDQINEMARGPIEWLLEPYSGQSIEAKDAAEEEAKGWTVYLLDERPSLLSALYIFLLFGLPFLVPMGSFNQVSGDIASKGLRYLLLRTERSNLFLGRFLGTAAFVAMVQAITMAVLVVYVVTNVGAYETADMVKWGLHGMAVFTVLTLPYVALASLLSACTDSPMAALVMNKVAIGGLLLAAVLLRLKWGFLDNVRWLLPWGVQNQLIAPEMGRVLGAVAACLGYTLVFLYLGKRRFESRDL